MDGIKMKMRLGIPSTTATVNGKRWTIVQFGVACRKYSARTGVGYDYVLETMRDEPEILRDEPEFQNPADHKPGDVFRLAKRLE